MPISGRSIALLFGFVQVGFIGRMNAADIRPPPDIERPLAPKGTQWQ